MRKASITVEPLTIPTYAEGIHQDLPMFVENRVHQRTSGRVYPNRVVVQVDREPPVDKTYEAVHLENDYLDLWVLPEIGGRIFAARDKTTGYDFFYRQHVIKPALIGVLGSWISGGVEFNWPFHHRASGFMPCDYKTEEAPDGSVICWLSEHDPMDRMKGTFGIVLRPDCAYFETRMRLTNRTPLRHSFLWWENAAVPVNENYQIFFPHDVTYVNFHYLDSRVSYPIAGDRMYNGMDLTEPRDISMHKNTRDATSYFACASKYDFFGGYDHGRACGVVHVADHHLSPGKKMFTWAYNQLSVTWENALTDTDGQYAELMAGSYSDNQPNFSWLEPYETKSFSQFWYPISKIGTPDFANLSCALRLDGDALNIQATVPVEHGRVQACTAGGTFLDCPVHLTPGVSVSIPWNRPDGFVTVRILDESGEAVAEYAEEKPDSLKMPPVKDPLPHASELLSADELYLAGVHVDQYRDPAVMPDAYWLAAIQRNPFHAPSLLGLARYNLALLNLEEARRYCERAIHVLTRFNERLESGEPYYLHGLILEALGEVDQAYDDFYKAAWSADCVARAMTRIACIDLRRGDRNQALRHARWAGDHDRDHPLVPVILMLADPGHAAEIAARALARDPMNLLVRWLSGDPGFFASLRSEPAQSVLDLVGDLSDLGQYDRCVDLLTGLMRARPEESKAMVCFALAWFNARLGLPCDPALSLAETAPLGGAYPSRALEAEILRFASDRGSVRAGFLLGCLLYDRRHYAEGCRLFEAYTRAVPEDYAGWRCLSVACFSHMNRPEDALTCMKKALELSNQEQLTYEAVSLMDRMGIPPAERVALLLSRPMTMDLLFVELAKAYNQMDEPDQALQALLGHHFVACEGGEHAIAEQYMFAWQLKGLRAMRESRFEDAAQAFREAFTLPQSLGSGLWNRCLLVPAELSLAECLLRLGRLDEAEKLLRGIVDRKTDFFTAMHLPELPYYQAKASVLLGLPQHAQRLMNDCKRQWTLELSRRDDGYFTTTPFFISFMQDASELRRAKYLYLLGLVDLYDGRPEEAHRKFSESHRLNGDHLYCGLYASL